MATLMGKTPQYISNIVTGGKGMSIATLSEIAEILDVEFRDLFDSEKKTKVTGFVKVNGVIYEVSSFDDIEKLRNLGEETT